MIPVTHSRYSSGATALIVAVLVAICAVTLSFSPPTAAASSDNSGLTSLFANGEAMPTLLGNAASDVVATAGRLPTTLVPAALSVADPVAGAVILGAPGTQATALGDCWWIFCSAILQDIGISITSCTVDVIKLASLHQCVTALSAVLGDFATLAMWPITEAITRGAKAFFALVQDTTAKMSKWLLEDELGGKAKLAAPVLSCKVAQGDNANASCRDAWFLGQYSIMRQVSLFMLLPIFMLVVIQSVIKGSMFMLVRATTIMLPAAIVGGVVIVFFAQLLLNLSDDFVEQIGNYTNATTGYGATMSQDILNVDSDKINYFALIWFVLIIFAVVIIYIELLLRQVGVYMSALFMPLAFAALVWPSSAKITKKLFELLVGLIFSKVFIAAAVSLGIAAFSSTTDGLSTVPNNDGLDANIQGLGAAISGTLIFMMAAFAGTKVISISPAAITAAEGRVMPLHNWAAKGQLFNTVVGRSAQLKNSINHRRGTRFNQGFDASAPRNSGTRAIPVKTVTGRTGQGATPSNPPPRPHGPRWKH